MGIDRDARRAVFLDRDGVINRPIVRDGKPYPPSRLEDLEVLPGVKEALARLRDAGFRVVVVTNQPDIARGTQRRDVVDAMHSRLRADLPIDEFRMCPHDDRDGCDCRKPSSGMIESAAHDSRLDLAGSFMIGDRWRDIEAGRRAGCTTILIDWHYDEAITVSPDFVTTSLPAAVDWIFERLALPAARALPGPPDRR
jgi:D-glycero-D-manno-heptose 1,7-bisphosphate phosphatase